MKRILFLFFYFFLSISLYAKTEIDKAFQKRGKNSNNKIFTIHSPDMYKDQQVRFEQIFNGFGCKGENLSPQLAWKNAPKNTKSFAITIFDKDANTGSGWWHWTIYDIPVYTNRILSGVSRNKKLLPNGAVETINDYGTKGYGGICVLDNKKHNYTITIYALNVEELDIPRKATPTMVRYFINQHKIATASINVFYQNKNKEDKNKKNKIVVDRNMNIDRNMNNKNKVIKIENKNKKNIIIDNKTENKKTNINSKDNKSNKSNKNKNSIIEGERYRR